VSCPHCGSASRSDWGYDCGSVRSAGFERSIHCRTKEMSNIRQELETANQRIKRLEEALESANTLLQLVMCEQNHLREVRNKANERIKRLEELGSELRDCASRIGTVASGEGSVIRRTQDAIKAWDKEAKL